MRIQWRGEGESWLSSMWALALAVTVAWIAIGALSLGRAALLVFAGVGLLAAAGAFRARLPWLLAPLLLPGIYALLVGWVDLRAVLPAAVLLVLTAACGLGGRLSRRGRGLAALLLYAAAGLGAALGLLPVETLLAALAAPLVARAARRGETETALDVQAYAVTVLLLWVGYLIHGIVR